MDTMTVGQRLNVTDLPETVWPRHELIDGSLHVTPAANIRHQQISTRLAVALTPLLPPDLVVLVGANIIPEPMTCLIPDVVVADRSRTRSGVLGFHPRDVRWVVEVLSPSTARIDRSLKRELYQDWGIPTYWLVDADRGEVHRFGSDPDPAWAGALDLTELLRE